jgi:hypothetical protein
MQTFSRPTDFVIFEGLLKIAVIATDRWAGVDKFWEQEKLEATRSEMLDTKHGGESPQPGVRFVGRPFAWTDAGS